MNVQTTLTNIPIAEAVPNPDAHYSVTCVDGAQRFLETHEVSAAVRSLAGATAWRTGLAEWTSNLEDLLGVYLRSGNDASVWVSITEARRVREGGCWVWVPTWVEWRELVVMELESHVESQPEPVRVVPLVVGVVKLEAFDASFSAFAARSQPDLEPYVAVLRAVREALLGGLITAPIVIGRYGEVGLEGVSILHWEGSKQRVYDNVRKCGIGADPLTVVQMLMGSIQSLERRTR